MPSFTRFAAAALLFSGIAAAASEIPPEQQLRGALDAAAAGELDTATDALRDLVRRQPNFRLAELLYGDMLAARSGVHHRPRLASDDPRLTDLKQEAQLRLRAWQDAPAPGLQPDALLQVSPAVKRVVFVDLPGGRVYLLDHRRDSFEVLHSYYAGIGKSGFHKSNAGDNRTPVGVYQINGWIDGHKLPKLYGAGALTLNYPNLWDQRQHRSGHGIWLHGVPPETYVRAPRSSEGCVTLANADLLSLKPFVAAGHTPVVLSDAPNWVAPDSLKAERDEFLKRIEDWRQQWSSRNTDAYLAYYSRDFATDGMDKAAFAAFKRRVNTEKRFIQVRLRDIELLRYPGPQPMVLARYTQDYRSDNFARSTQKQQLWRKEDSGWKIVMEENR